MSGTVCGFVVATTCGTVEELIERYHTRIEETSIFVGIVEERVLGTECAFAILLANKQPALAGICIVREIFHDANNPYRRRGMKIDIQRLGVTSERLFADMLSARAAHKRRFAQGTASHDAAVPETDDAIPITVDEEASGSIPIDLREDLTSAAADR
jgi:hypothetical protein